MSNYTQTRQEIKTYLIARVPLIVIDTSERERAERILRELAENLTTQIDYYTDARQVEHFGRGSGYLDVDNDPLPFITAEFRKKRGCIFALGDVRRIGDDCTYSRELLNILYLAQESSCTLILITPDPVWQRITQFGMIARLDLPDIEERTMQISRFVQAYQGRFRMEWEQKDILHAAALLRGFTEIQISNILASTLVANRGLGQSQLPELTNQKNRLYSSVAAVEQVRVSEHLEVAGLENLKHWLAEKRRVFFAPDEVLAARGLNPPKGILLVGIPGCGKSISAKMVAKSWSLPLYRFDLGAIYDKWMGESERKMKEALQFLDSVAPCVVWMDEIEKGLTVSDGSNDTGRRVLGQFLFWLQESGNRVFLIATANDIRALPSELFRKGRFSQTFFVDLPNERERREVIGQYCGQALHWEPEEAEMERLAKATAGFSYADIEDIIKDLAQQAMLYGESIVTVESLLERFAANVSFADGHPDLVKDLRTWGRERAIPASQPEEEVSI